MTDTHAVAQMELSQLAEQLRARERQIAAAVQHHRRAGVPWSVIGASLGVSKQAAQQRYGRPLS